MISQLMTAEKLPIVWEIPTSIRTKWKQFRRCASQLSITMTKYLRLYLQLWRKQKSYLGHGFRSSDPLLFSPTDMNGYVKPIVLGSFSHLCSTSRSSSKEEGTRNIGWCCHKSYVTIIHYKMNLHRVSWEGTRSPGRAELLISWWQGAKGIKSPQIPFQSTPSIASPSSTRPVGV